MKVERLFLTILVSAALAGCGGGGGGGGSTAPSGGGSSSGTGGGGGGVTPPPTSVTQTVSAQQGGSLEAGGASLVVPAGALQQDAPVTLAVVAQPAQLPANDGMVPVGQAVRISGSSAVFEAAVQLALPSPGGAAPEMVILTDSGGLSTVLDLSEPDARGTMRLDARQTLWLDHALEQGPVSVAYYRFEEEPNEVAFMTSDEAAWRQPRVGDRYAIVLHGINSDGHAMTPLATALQDTGRYRAVARFQYEYTGGADVAAEKLRQQLNTAASPLFQYPGATVDLYAHSFGGIVCREFIQNKGGRQVCSRLYTIATPHEGSPAVDPTLLMTQLSNLQNWVFGQKNGARWSSQSPTIRWLRPRSDEIEDLKEGYPNISPRLEAVKTVVGDRFPVRPRELDLIDLALSDAAAFLFGNTRSDGVVGTASASPSWLIQDASHDVFTLDANHVEITSRDEVHDRLRTWVAGLRGRVLFGHLVSGDGRDWDDDWDLYTAPADPQTGEGQPLREELVFGSAATDFGGGGFQGGISPDYSSCVFTSSEDGSHDVYLAEARGMHRTAGVSEVHRDQLRNLTRDGYFNFYPSFSRDGSRIVYFSRRENDRVHLCEIRPDGTGKRSVHVLNLPASVRNSADQVMTEFVRATYSPDGTRILFNDWFQEGETDVSDLDLFTVRVDGTGRTSVYIPTDPQTYPTWIDERTAAFSSTRSGSEQVYLLDLLTNAVTQVTSTGTNWSPKYYPSWNDAEPGQSDFLTFVSTRGGTHGVYRYDLDTRAITKLVGLPGTNRRTQ